MVLKKIIVFIWGFLLKYVIGERGGGLFLLGLCIGKELGVVILN